MDYMSICSRKLTMINNKNICEKHFQRQFYSHYEIRTPMSYCLINILRVYEYKIQSKYYSLAENA